MLCFTFFVAGTPLKDQLCSESTQILAKQKSRFHEVTCLHSPLANQIVKKSGSLGNSHMSMWDFVDDLLSEAPLTEPG